jgi:hypothetical protein
MLLHSRMFALLYGHRRTPPDIADTNLPSLTCRPRRIYLLCPESILKMKGDLTRLTLVTPTSQKFWHRTSEVASSGSIDQTQNSKMSEQKAQLESQTQAENPDDFQQSFSQYPSGVVLGATLFALCLAVLCVALDNTIISTAIPRITDEFHALQDVGWYGSGTSES